MSGTDTDVERLTRLLQSGAITAQEYGTLIEEIVRRRSGQFSPQSVGSSPSPAAPPRWEFKEFVIPLDMSARGSDLGDQRIVEALRICAPRITARIQEWIEYYGQDGWQLDEPIDVISLLY